MTIREVKEELHEDILSVLDSFRANEDMDKGDYEDFKFALFFVINKNLDKITEL